MDDQSACRAFASFDEFIKGDGEDGPDAEGQVQGMVVDAQQASSAGPGQAGTSRLLTALEALKALAGSSQWKPAPAQASSPQFDAVSTACQPFLPQG